MQRDWSVFDLVRARRTLKLPVVLSTREVRAIFAAVEQPVYRMAFITLYAFGLRINEGLHLETGDIDADRNTLWVRDGKGARDRAVPLPRPVLGRLRAYWKEDRPAVPSKLIFPGLDGQRPPDPSTLQKAFTAARLAAKVDKPCTPHTLRHSFASHLLEAGVSLRTIQQVMGHKSLRTTEVYLHVTQTGVERLQEVVDRLMADL